MQFEVKRIKNNNIKKELEGIGFDSAYISNAILKHEFVTLKIKNAPCHVATIIKETALSKGADAGISRGVLLREVESTDIILSGTIKQLQNIAKSLSIQPFGIKEIAAKILEILKTNSNTKTIMGILNITEDSFSDGGNYINATKAIKHGIELIKDGAKIIDIGAESTYPDSKPIKSDVEIERLTPVVKEFLKEGVKISIDTRNSKTAEIMLNLGVSIINDVSMANYDPKITEVIKNYDCDYVLTHSRGIPQNMDDCANYNNVADEVYTELNNKIEFLIEKGIKKERIIADIGFGFAKNIEQNFELLEKIGEFKSLGVRLLSGTSRKRFLKSLAHDKTNETTDKLTAMTSFYLFENGVDIIRVHNVKDTVLALQLFNSIYGQKCCL